MDWPQLIWVFFAGSGLAFKATEGGQQFWTQIVTVILVAGLLYWGGFFNVWIQ